MKEFIEYIARNIVDKPDSVRVIRASDTSYQLMVDPGDIGKVIGKHGTMISFIRVLVNSVHGSGKNRISLEIIE